MIRDDIIRMAREAGMAGMLTDVVTTFDELERFFRLAYEAGAAAEREECAKVAERMLRFYTQAVTGVPQAIRARGQA